MRGMGLNLSTRWRGSPRAVVARSTPTERPRTVGLPALGGAEPKIVAGSRRGTPTARSPCCRAAAQSLADRFFTLDAVQELAEDFAACPVLRTAAVAADPQGRDLELLHGPGPHRTEAFQSDPQQFLRELDEILLDTTDPRLVAPQ
ncbi:hypothetical protein QJS66_09760 [Kocuria rhizophila]|nr:hypothetical protein QJS66_09760 [Kocuria rhizophila]